MEARTLTTEMVRAAMQGFCAGGKRVSNAQLYVAMGLTCEQEKDRLRTRVGDMVKRGEAIKIAPGLYEYNFKFRLNHSDTYGRIWRFIRTQKPGWNMTTASQLTHVSYRHVCRYIGWLENAGFVDRQGKDGSTVLFRTTDKAMRTPETPYPPVSAPDPFERENAAAAQIARLMLCHDPYQPKTAREITAACKILLARFETEQPAEAGKGETA